MNNRLARTVAPRLAAPLAVVTLIGLMGLAARSLPVGLPHGHSDTAGLASRVPASADREEARLLALPRGSQAVWLPPPGRPTRTVLTSFPLDTGSPGSTLGAEATTEGSESDCPKLIFKDPGDCPRSRLALEPAFPAPLPLAEDSGSAVATPVPAQTGPAETLTQPPVAEAIPAPEEPSPPPTAVDLDDDSPQAPGLLPVADPQKRSRNLELIARGADARTRRGFELAGRGAFFSARAEFIMALRLIAQGLDAEHQTTGHSRALAAGLTALKEAEDFVPRGSQLEADLDLPNIIRTHRTPVLKDAATASLTSLEAVQCYLTFAQEQLGEAAGSEVAGSMALYGLGKLHHVEARKDLLAMRAGEAKSMVFYQAALLVCPRHYMASNDLGFLLAQAGRYEDARIVLEHSVSTWRHPSGWRNLAVVYHQLGRQDLARNAMQESASLQQREPKPGNAEPAVRWVDAKMFVQWGDKPDMAQPAVAAAVPGRPETAPLAKAATDSPQTPGPKATGPPPEAKDKDNIAQKWLWKLFSK